MKTKSKLPMQIVSLVTMIGLLSLWVYKTKEPFDPLEYVTFGLIVLIIGIILYFTIDSYKSERAGLNSQDELSKRTKEKAAALAFKLSVYMWAFIILFLTDLGPRAKIIMGLGLIGMGLIFIVTWLYLSKVGISDENQD